MSSVTLHHPSMLNQYQNFPVRDIPENSTWLLKAFCAVPYLSSYVVYNIISSSLNERMASATYNPQKLVELIQLKNEYTIASTIGDMIGTALTVSFLASITFPSILLIFVGVFGGSIAIGKVFNIVHNNHVAHEIMTTGFRDGMVIK